MSNPDPNITIPVDLTNPGQFFACCGLLELADRLWPGAEGWFESKSNFVLIAPGRTSIEPLLKKVIGCAFVPLLPENELTELRHLSKRKSELKARKKALPKADEAHRKALNSKRIVAGFRLCQPFNLRVDWWQLDGCDANHLKTWAGQQAIAEIAEDMKASLEMTTTTELLECEKRIVRKDGGKARAPLSFDSGRAGTAQDIGYSADNVGQPIACCLWTEFLALVALQRFSLKPDAKEVFTFHAWSVPLSVSVAAMATRGAIEHVTGCTGRFRLSGRDVDNRFLAFQQATLSKWSYR